MISSSSIKHFLRIVMFGQAQQRLAHCRIAPKPLRSIDQPQIQLILGGPDVRDQLRVISLRVVHQISGMHFEEPGQQLAGGVGQVRPRPALDLRQVRLADGFPSAQS